MASNNPGYTSEDLLDLDEGLNADHPDYNIWMRGAGRILKKPMREVTIAEAIRFRLAYLEAMLAMNPEVYRRQHDTRISATAAGELQFASPEACEPFRHFCTGETLGPRA